MNKSLDKLIEKFPWGDIIKIHMIGNYQIIEFIDYEKEISFKPYIDCKDCHCSYPSLDTALISALCNNTLEHDEAIYAVRHICKILEIE